MTYNFYKVTHILGILMLFSAWGGLLLFRFLQRTEPGSKTPVKMIMITHGLGLIITLIAGFGLLARLNIQSPWPLWVYGKLFIWLCLGGGVVLAKKKPQAWQTIWAGVVILGLTSAFLAIYKPL